jgi:hypothetical protein
MPSRGSEVLVIKFLRGALAVDALGVPELEARARATGLLGEGQPSAYWPRGLCGLAADLELSGAPRPHCRADELKRF